MSLDIDKSCSFQILISLTTVVRPGDCHLKSEVAALNWCWCCHVASSALVTTAADTNVSDKKKCWILQPIRPWVRWELL